MQVAAASRWKWSFLISNAIANWLIYSAILFKIGFSHRWKQQRNYPTFFACFMCDHNNTYSSTVLVYYCSALSCCSFIFLSFPSQSTRCCWLPLSARRNRFWFVVRSLCVRATHRERKREFVELYTHTATRTEPVNGVSVNKRTECVAHTTLKLHV